jgi:hypothetical protein
MIIPTLMLQSPKGVSPFIFVTGIMAGRNRGICPVIFHNRYYGRKYRGVSPVFFVVKYFRLEIGGAYTPEIFLLLSPAKEFTSINPRILIACKTAPVLGLTLLISHYDQDNITN